MIALGWLLLCFMFLGFALGLWFSDWQRQRELLARRRSLEARFESDAAAYRFAAQHPSLTPEQLRALGICADDVRQALEDLR